MEHNEVYTLIGKDIIGAAFDVRKNVGKGLRESYYKAALVYELKKRGRQVDTEVIIPATYCGVVVSDAYYADIVVDNKVIIELKAISTLSERECRQLLTYLKLSDFKLGYLINFGANNFCLGRTDEKLPFKHGIYRLVNNL